MKFMNFASVVFSRYNSWVEYMTIVKGNSPPPLKKLLFPEGTTINWFGLVDLLKSWNGPNKKHGLFINQSPESLCWIRVRLLGWSKINRAGGFSTLIWTWPELGPFINWAEHVNTNPDSWVGLQVQSIKELPGLLSKWAWSLFMLKRSTRKTMVWLFPYIGDGSP